MFRHHLDHLQVLNSYTFITHLAEFKNFETEYKLGDVITVDYLEDAGFVDVVGTSKGKGFQGVVKLTL